VLSTTRAKLVALILQSTPFFRQEGRSSILWSTTSYMYVWTAEQLQASSKVKESKQVGTAKKSSPD
jgi:hypothetical protein